MGGRVAGCQVYPPALCAAMCRGIAKQKAADAGGERNTGKALAKELYSLIGKIMDEPTGSTIRNHKPHCPIMMPIGGWKNKWIDNVHVPDGGADLFGHNKRV